MGIVYTILIFGLVIFIHELGHFLVAKACGVKVIEFALGMGPVLLKKQGKETLYTLRLLPIGGYAAMEGEVGSPGDMPPIDDDAPTALDDAPAALPKNDKSRAFCDKSVIKRILICIAGATMNLLLGFVIIGFTLIGTKSFATTTIHSFRENAVSSQHGLEVGDKIVKVNKTHMFTDRDIVFEMLRDGDGVYDITVVRDGKKAFLPDVKFDLKEQDGKKQVYFDFVVTSKNATFFNGFTRAFSETFSLARNSWTSIYDLITGKVSVTELSGPVGVSQVVAQAAKIGFMTVVNLAAFISISIGMFNLLPFPALDGGRVVIYLIEAVRKKPISQKVEGYINATGLVILLALMALVTVKDIWNLF